MPADLDATLNELEPFARYKVDRLRHESAVLENHETLDPMHAFWASSNRAGQTRLDETGCPAPNPPSDAFAHLRGLNGAALASALGVLVNNPKTGPIELGAALDVLPRLPKAQATVLQRRISALASALPHGDSLPLLTKQLALAVDFDDAALAKSTLGAISPTLATVEPTTDNRQALVAAFMAASKAAHHLRLRSGALAHHGRLQELVARSPDDGSAISFGAALATQHYALGDTQAGNDALDAALARFDHEGCPLIPVERQRALHLLGLAASAGPEERHWAIVNRLASGFQFVTDSFNTNTHYSIYVIGFIDALVAPMGEPLRGD